MALTIKSTTDYDQFQTFEGNRVVDHNHVGHLQLAMVRNPDGFASKPAIINEHGFIIDGQHRWKAAMLAGAPFYYVVQPGLSLEAAREMNIHQKKWTLQDYAKSFADSGRKDYQKLIDMQRNHPGLSLGTLIVACTGIDDYTLTAEFKSGEFGIDDIELAEERATMLTEIHNRTGRAIPVPFARVLIRLMKTDDFDESRFVEKLNLKPELLIPSGISKDNYRTIEDVYNYKSKAPKRLY